MEMGIDRCYYRFFLQTLLFQNWNSNIWRIQYNLVYSWMHDFFRDTMVLKRVCPNKYGTFHYLSFNAFKELNISFFENVVWQNRYK